MFVDWFAAHYNKAFAALGSLWRGLSFVAARLLYSAVEFAAPHMAHKRLAFARLQFAVGHKPVVGSLDHIEGHIVAHRLELGLELVGRSCCAGLILAPHF